MAYFIYGSASAHLVNTKGELHKSMVGNQVSDLE